MQNNIDFLRCNAQIQSHGWSSGSGWEPISSFFGSSLDGQNKHISNLFISGSGKAFINNLQGGSEIKNLGLLNVYISSTSNRVGSFAGEANGAYIYNSFAIGSVKTSSSPSQVGGLVGINFYSEIEESYFRGSVEGLGNNVGGLIGETESGGVYRSHVIGSVEGLGNNVGGLIGYVHWGNNYINESFVVGSVTGEEFVGGLVGYAYHDYANIRNSYSEAIITGSSNVGGLVGSSGGSFPITGDSYWFNYSTDDATQCVSDWDTSGTDCYAVQR